MLRVTPEYAVPERELRERFVRSSGPGGQNVNKVATAVELRFDVGASALPADVQRRLLALAGTRASAEGIILVDSRAFRTQARNREAARARLAALIRQAFRRPKSRTKTTPTAASRERRLAEKAQRSRVKARRASIETDDD
ncbi:MAG TPA: alternative ribosome rescue aminoacyl-tRNA hydrolase ArfB [Vicinamibacterales bacterium]|mgnify:FL=1|nr:alternative ribosome rescue aminoacyl-tRNA hydrolase ArfB [Vicinamibacterales bacterium]HPW19751.1 alternative ribosome rescue aminoacyl-tRNA hydrolase ArfB [Vicinamibacterales bacterium]